VLTNDDEPVPDRHLDVTKLGTVQRDHVDYNSSNGIFECPARVQALRHLIKHNHSYPGAEAHLLS
jgi:hypothetical protein